jgi:hypothetical protein
MNWDTDDQIRLAILVLAVLLATVISSFGFSLVTENPIAPNTEFDLHDAEEQYDISRQGVVDYFILEHVSGEPINPPVFELIVGSRNAGLVLTRERNWTDSSGSLTYQVRTPRGALPTSEPFSEGDRVVVSKIDGTLDIETPVTVRVRLYHTPSQQTLLDRTITVN